MKQNIYIKQIQNIILDRHHLNVGEGITLLNFGHYGRGFQDFEYFTLH